MKKLNREELENTDFDIGEWLANRIVEDFQKYLDRDKETNPNYVRGSGCPPPKTGTLLYADGREVSR